METPILIKVLLSQSQSYQDALWLDFNDFTLKINMKYINKIQYAG